MEISSDDPSDEEYSVDKHPSDHESEDEYDDDNEAEMTADDADGPDTEDDFDGPKKRTKKSTHPLPKLSPQLLSLTCYIGHHKRQSAATSNAPAATMSHNPAAITDHPAAIMEAPVATEYSQPPTKKLARQPQPKPAGKAKGRGKKNVPVLCKLYCPSCTKPILTLPPVQADEPLDDQRKSNIPTPCAMTILKWSTAEVESSIPSAQARKSNNS